MREKQRRLIGFWQIACGALGLLGLVLASLDLPRGSRRVLVDLTGPYNIVGALFFFGACIVLGLALLRGERRGLVGSTVCQAVQILSFAFLAGPQVLIQADPRIALTVSNEQFNLSAGFNSVFFVGTLVAGPTWQISINLLAVIWTVLLLRAKRFSSAGLEGVAV